MFRLLVDTREKLGIPENIKKLFGLSDVLRELEITTLESGDYQIYQGDKLIAIIERKTLNDLSASMGERRNNLNNLLLERQNTNCDLYYLIEGPQFPSQYKTFSRKPYKMLESYLFTLHVKYKVMILYSKNAEHTCQQIIKLYNKYYDKYLEYLEHQQLENNNSENSENSESIIEGSNDSEDTEKIIQLNIPNIPTLKILDEDGKQVCKMWMSIRGINTERAIDRAMNYSIIEYIKSNSNNLPIFTQCIMLSRIHRLSLNAAKIIIKESGNLVKFNETDNKCLRYQITSKTKLSMNMIKKIKKYINYKIE